MINTMKLIKIAVIAIIAASSFSTAKAQVVVNARIGTGPTVYHEPVRRPVHRKVYHRPRRVIVRQPVHHHRRPRPIVHRRSRPVVIVKHH